MMPEANLIIWGDAHPPTRKTPDGGEAIRAKAQATSKQALGSIIRSGCVAPQARQKGRDKMATFRTLPPVPPPIPSGIFRVDQRQRQHDAHSDA
jgi:hypothetical protein